MKEKQPSESQEQMEVVKWFRQTYHGVLIFAIANGGKRSISEACRLKCEGVVKGIPDLFIPAWRLWVEMKKAKGGVVSEEQKSVIKYLQSVGYSAIVCAGAEEAKCQIAKHGETQHETRKIPDSQTHGESTAAD